MILLILHLRYISYHQSFKYSIGVNDSCRFSLSGYTCSSTCLTFTHLSHIDTLPMNSLSYADLHCTFVTVIQCFIGLSIKSLTTKYFISH